MSEEIKEIYKGAFCQLLNQRIGISSFDEKIESANLFFAPSNDIHCNVNSKYFSVLNDFYLSKLSEDELVSLEGKKEIDSKVLEVVERTYKECIKKDGVSGIMYGKPRPDHYVENGSVVLEFVYGKNTRKLSDEEYMEIYRQQKNFINSMVE